jgi:hypothetical protein
VLLSRRPVPDKFLVAFSFAGEQRDLVRSIAEEVEKRLGPGKVFLDEWYEHYIAGDNADQTLQDIYHKRSELVVFCISKPYGDKPWTRVESEAIRAFKMQLSRSTVKSHRLRILPLRVGDGDVEGILVNTICPDARKKPAAQTAELIISRLQLIRRYHVYLAECTPDLEDPDKPINRQRMKAFLEELGFEVLPTTEYPVDKYQILLEQDLEKCIAFVQLIDPWKRGGSDRIQNDAAATLPIARFRYRSAEIDLEKVESTHRAFLTAPDVIASGFEDFKVYLAKRLTVLAQRQDRVPAKSGDQDNPPLVVVAIPSPQPDPLWHRVFQWVQEQRIRSYMLEPGETIDSRSQAEPCHGFLIACDAAAVDDGSPRGVIEQCRQVQLREKNGARRPPVALVYWPPPSPSWSKLLHSTPVKFHCVLGDEPEKLSGFFAEVRKVAQ